jgi:hypothetical protein
VGQKFAGPVVLICDALAFSTADIFSAGFMDNAIGKVICIDTNMAAAGGNNWVPWDIVRLYNPDFKLNEQLKLDIEAGRLSEGVFDAFNSAGVSLSKKAVLESPDSEYEGRSWRLQDGGLTHVVRDLPWMSPELEVYLARGKSGLTVMPSGITFSVTMRRSLSVNENEGRVLEDVGIAPDIFYHMTLHDIMEENQDLFESAGKELRRAIATT